MSFDAPAANAAFARKHRFPFPLLSDLDRAWALRFGAAGAPGARYARRVSALIDERGQVIRLYPKVDPRTHAAQVLADLGGPP